MLDFHHCAALGLNKAIVRPGPEGLQKKIKKADSGPGCRSGHTQVAMLSRSP